MKLFLWIFCIFLFSLHAQEYSKPESAAYDPIRKQFLISNYNSGNIFQIDSTGKKSIFKRDLNRPLGMVIVNNTLYLVENRKSVKGFDLTNKIVAMDLLIEEAVFLNDITSDDTGFLYVTDSNANTIFKIDMHSEKYSLFLKTEYDGPNGIIFDHTSNRLIVCYFIENASIQTISLNDTLNIETVARGLVNLDGITIDNQYNIYVSSWGKGSFTSGFHDKGIIYKFESTFTKTPAIISTDHYGPADIYFNKEANILVIPYFLDNMVEFMTELKVP